MNNQLKIMEVGRRPIYGSFIRWLLRRPAGYQIFYDFRVRKHAKAFTLLEMLVAVAATVVLVLFINKIFESMTDAVRAGKQTSEVIESNRTVNEQISDDAGQMVGPVDGGFIVIVQRQIRGVKINTSSHRAVDDPIPDPPRPDIIPPAMRADQVLWVRTRGPAEPQCPKDIQLLAPPASNGDYAMVWYGNTIKTEPDGLIARPLGDIGPDPLKPWRNYYAAQWALGRQAMILDPGAAEPYIDPANGQVVQDPTSGYGGGRNWIEGISDILQDGLPAINTAFLPPGDQSYAYRYLGHRWYRLPALSGIESIDVAQAHPFLISNVSDVQVTFAADHRIGTTYNDGVDAVIDTHPAGNIVWYDAFKPLPTPPPTPPVMREWPRIAPSPPKPLTDGAPVQYNYGAGTALQAVGDKIDANEYRFVFTRSSAAFWPYMIRITYRLHGQGQNMVGQDGVAGRVFERIIRVNRP